MREAIAASSTTDVEYSHAPSYAHFLAGQLYQNKGDLRSAIEQYRLALATDTRNPHLWVYLAEAHWRAGQGAKAKRELKRLLQQFPKHADGYLSLGRILFEEKALKQAKPYLLKAVELAPKNPDGYVFLAQLQVSEGASQQAMATVESLAAHVPGDWSGYRRVGLSFAEKGDLIRAEVLLERALAMGPQEAELWQILGEIYEANLKLDKAREAYLKALARQPDEPELLLASGKLALRRQATAEAHEYFDRLLSISSTPEILMKVALSYLSVQDYGSASQMLDRARKQGLTDPKLAYYAGLLHEKVGEYSSCAEAMGDVASGSEMFAQAQAQRASCLSAAGEHDTATELFKTLVEAAPRDVRLLALYGRSLLRAGKSDLAEGILTKALAQRRAPEVVEALCDLYQRKGQPERAMALLGEALSKRPNDEVLLYRMGALYQKLGEWQRSLALMRDLVKRNPEHAEALNFIGYVLMDKGQSLDEAERYIRRALKLKPDNGAFLDSLGWLYFHRGDSPKAIEALERAAALLPTEPLVIEHLGDAYSKSSQKALAERAYRRALEAVRRAESLEDLSETRRSIEQKLMMLSSERAQK
jgi:tetratricopeptide (TPR) repeat protein